MSQTEALRSSSVLSHWGSSDVGFKKALLLPVVRSEAVSGAVLLRHFQFEHPGGV